MSVEKETVKIIAVNKMYKEKPYIMCMPFDQATGKPVSGLEGISQARLSKYKGELPKPSDGFAVRNNDTFNLTKDAKGEYEIDKDFIMYSLAMVEPSIANTKAELNPSVHLFYLENYEQEAKEVVGVAKLKAKAGGKVADVVTLSDMYDIIFFLGHNPLNLTASRAEKLLYDMVESRPTDVLSYFDNLEASKKVVFIEKGLQYGNIKKNGNGYLVFDDHVLGANVTEAVTFVYDNAHITVFNTLKDLLNKKENIK